ncbi:MAG: pyridoxamine 5'-phosphate oxidase [Pseudomonadota bacterium]
MERGELFSQDNPFSVLEEWMAAAAKTEINDPNAMALATVDNDGLPNVRIVLLKQLDDDGIVFFTNYNSAKGRELDTNRKAAFVIHWKSLGRQVRGRGRVERVTDEVSDAYYQTRALDSRLGAWASDQTQPLEDRATLMEKVEAARQRFGDSPPRPPHWGGFRLTPNEMEFWADGAFRLHDRFRWSRASAEKDWQIKRLYP